MNQTQEESRLQSVKRFFRDATLQDLGKGIAYGVYYSKTHLIDSFVIIPSGILVLFTILYGFNQLLSNVLKIRFPSSVLGMLINLILLSVLSVLAELQSTDKTSLKYKVSKWSSFIFTNYLRLIKPSMNFTLKWINVFFIPSFIILPLSDPISFIECLKIAGVFAVGFLSLFCVDVYLILGLKWVYRSFGFMKGDDNSSHDNKQNTPEVEYDDGEGIEEIELQSLSDSGDGAITTMREDITTMRDDITTIDLSSLRTTKNEPVVNNSINENPFTQEVSMNSVDIPNIPEPGPIHLRDSQPPPSLKLTPVSTIVRSNSPSVASSSQPESLFANDNLTKSCQSIIIFITNYIDWILYFILFIVSLPFYYIKSIHVFLPYHLGLTIISYYIALLIPLRWPKLKKIAHPILILTAEILFVCFIGSLIFHKGELKGFLDDLKFYKTGKTYLNLFNDKVLLNSGKIDHELDSDYTATPKWPGCGDVLSSLMDISIVSLSLPMFTHRKDFLKNFWVLVPPILISIALTFFCYPIICYNIGIASQRSIGFIGRSVTLALGTPLIDALDGSISLMAVCTILSGICGVLVGDTLFRMLRVSKDDYVTRGVSLGINCGAIATAHLLNVDPRAALMSSLGFSIFGTIMVIMASIGAVKDLIKSWVGL